MASKHTVQAQAANAGSGEWIKTEIYFGCDLPGGKQVSRGAWAEFMDTVLTRHFPKGMTVFEAYGQMRHADGHIEKQSTWVAVWVHRNSPEMDKRFRDIVGAYRKRFGKVQLMHLSTPVTAAQFFAD